MNQKAQLLLGSDDGVKVWFNDQLLHINNVTRGATADDDTIQIQLQKGWNELVLKITNGDGGWGAIARLIDTDGNALKGIAEKDYISSSETATTKYLDSNNYYLTSWQVAGPFSKDDLKPEQLFNVTFSPEVKGQNVDWKIIDIQNTDHSAKWNIKGDEMEVQPGSGSIMTKQKYKNFQLHIEFRSPFMPHVTEQKRGNSGVYVQGRYEIQVLDSYGLDGKDNECGGIYKVAPPAINMCAPPTQWQTYDISFLSAEYNELGENLKSARMTVLHNGIPIHKDLEIPTPTPGGLDTDMSIPGPILLQDHNDLVQYRNIWLVEK